MADGSKSEFITEEHLEQQHQSNMRKMDLIIDMLRELCDYIRTPTSPTDHGSELSTMNLQPDDTIGDAVTCDEQQIEVQPNGVNGVQVEVQPIEVLGWSADRSQSNVQQAKTSIAAISFADIVKEQVRTQSMKLPFVDLKSNLRSGYEALDVNGSINGSTKAWFDEVTSIMEVVFGKTVMEDNAHKVFGKMSKLRTQVSSFHTSSKSIFVDMKDHELDVDLGVDGILMFIFDPGGYLSLQMDCDVLRFDNRFRHQIGLHYAVGALLVLFLSSEFTFTSINALFSVPNFDIDWDHTINMGCIISKIFEDIDSHFQNAFTIALKSLDSRFVNEEAELRQCLGSTKTDPTMGWLGIASMELMSALWRLFWYIELAFDGVDGVSKLVDTLSILSRRVIMDQGSVYDTKSKVLVKYIAEIEYNAHETKFGSKQHFHSDNPYSCSNTNMNQQLEGLGYGNNYGSVSDCWKQFQAICSNGIILMALDWYDLFYPHGGDVPTYLKTHEPIDNHEMMNLIKCSEGKEHANLQKVTHCPSHCYYMDISSNTLLWGDSNENSGTLHLVGLEHILLRMVPYNDVVIQMLECIVNVVRTSLLSTLLENFVWDPGQDIILLYILEDKDIFERVGNDIIGEGLKGSTYYNAHLEFLACSLINQYLLLLFISRLLQWCQDVKVSDVFEGGCRDLAYTSGLQVHLYKTCLSPKLAYFTVNQAIFGDFDCSTSTASSKNFVWDPGVCRFTTLRTRRLLRGRICHDMTFYYNFYMYFRIY